MKKMIAAATLALASTAFAAQPNPVQHVSPAPFSCTVGRQIDVNVKFNVGLKTNSVRVYLNGDCVTRKLRITGDGITGILGNNDGLTIGNKNCGESTLTNVLRVYGREWNVARGTWCAERQYATNFFYVNDPIAPAPSSLEQQASDAANSLHVMFYHVMMAPVIVGG